MIASDYICRGIGSDLCTKFGLAVTLADLDIFERGSESSEVMHRDKK